MKGLIGLRQMHDGKYSLDQNMLINSLANLWGRDTPSGKASTNDNLRLFGIVMTIENNQPIYKRLAAGTGERLVLDDPILSLPQVFSTLALQFNNIDIKVTLPKDMLDVEGHDEINPNDPNIIRIPRDGTFFTISVIIVNNR